MRVEVDLTMANYGAHMPYVRCQPESDVDEAWIDQQTARSPTGDLLLWFGVKFERRNPLRNRGAPALYELIPGSTPAAVKVALSLWLPVSSGLSIRYDAKRLHAHERDLLDEVLPGWAAEAEMS